MRIQSFEEKFNESYYNLSRDEIYELHKKDNGPINNVISRINRDCYGVNLYEGKPIIVDMYYINNDSELQGDLFRLDIHDTQYFQLLLRFCIYLSEIYKDLDAIDTFNTFQINLRGFVEKLGFFTVTDAELLPYKGKNLSMMAKSPIYRVRTINKTEFYRMYLNFDDHNSHDVDVDYVYLMVNEDTSLIKIGTSKKPKYREKTLHSQEPKINIIAKWRCNKQIERELHAMFDHRTVRGEWFRLTLRDLKLIEDLMSGSIK